MLKKSYLLCILVFLNARIKIESQDFVLWLEWAGHCWLNQVFYKHSARTQTQRHPLPLLYEKGCALQHHISCLHRQKSMKWKLCTLIGQSFSHFKCHPSVRDSSFQASTLSLYIFCIFPLIYFSLTDLSHTRDKAWTDLSLHKFASYLLTHVQLDLCKVRNFCLLHSADW